MITASASTLHCTCRASCELVWFGSENRQQLGRCWSLLKDSCCMVYQFTGCCSAQLVALCGLYAHMPVWHVPAYTQCSRMCRSMICEQRSWHASDASVRGWALYRS